MTEATDSASGIVVPLWWTLSGSMLPMRYCQECVSYGESVMTKSTGVSSPGTATPFSVSTIPDGRVADAA